MAVRTTQWVLRANFGPSLRRVREAHQVFARYEDGAFHAPLLNHLGRGDSPDLTTGNFLMPVSYTGAGTIYHLGRATITGGTGRFAGASGVGVIHSTDRPGGTANEVPVVFDLDGVISTVGSAGPSKP